MDNNEFRRRYERKNYTTDVIFSAKGRAIAGTLRDLSMGGAFVMCMSASKISKGDTVTISIPFTSGEGNIKRKARVIWTNKDGFAVAFL